MAIIAVLIGYNTESYLRRLRVRMNSIFACFKRVYLSWVLCIELIGIVRSLKWLATGWAMV